jgi:hypothetical protein
VHCAGRGYALSNEQHSRIKQIAVRMAVSHFLNEEKTTGSWLPNMETATTAAAEQQRTTLLKRVWQHRKEYDLDRV